MTLIGPFNYSSSNVFKAIIERDETMADKSNDDTQNYPFIDYNLWLKHLDTQLNEPTNQNSLKIPKVIKPTSNKTLFKNFGD